MSQLIALDAALVRIENMLQGVTIQPRPEWVSAARLAACGTRTKPLSRQWRLLLVWWATLNAVHFEI